MNIKIISMATDNTTQSSLIWHLKYHNFWYSKLHVILKILPYRKIYQN